MARFTLHVMHLSECGLWGAGSSSRCNCRGRFPDGQDTPARLRSNDRRFVGIAGSESRLVVSQFYLEVVADEDDDWNVGECRSRLFWRGIGLPDLMSEKKSRWDER